MTALMQAIISDCETGNKVDDIFEKNMSTNNDTVYLYSPAIAGLFFMCARWAHVLTGESPQSAWQWEGYSRSQGCPP